ncbi:MAG: hypothetical protein MUF48_12285 [Pirellulaceae bacterium]|nr:hypothetical protein [Pirellulaceae bacterium]
MSTVLGANPVSGRTQDDDALPESVAWVRSISDAEIRLGVEAAILRNLLPAATQRHYPGHFTISADGAAFGSDTTWPGLDSWQMTGAYLQLGHTQLVLDYFEFVRASQRADGNIPFAIFSGETRSEGKYLRGLKYPDDAFAYDPPRREGLPASSQQPRTWMRLFEHWQPQANPLSTLAAVCYVLTAAEIFDATGSQSWLQPRLASVAAAAAYLLSRKGDNGLVGGSGFYMEMPPRYGNDGVTQCYVVHAFRELARLYRAVGSAQDEATWLDRANALRDRFCAVFWCQDHFAEYVHAERGLVDAHGLSDVNWAAVAFDIATESHVAALWPRLMAETGFWRGGMPTQNVTRPFTYQPWELHEPLPFPVASPLNDIAAMGRVWHLEATACRRQGAHERLVESIRHVCRARSQDGFWRERYHPQPDGSVAPAGAAKYCEYPAVLVRAALTNREILCPEPTTD